MSSFTSKLQGSDSFWTDSSSVPLLSNFHILRENNLPVADTNVPESVRMYIRLYNKDHPPSIDCDSKFMVTSSTLGDAPGFNGLSSRQTLFIL